MMSTQALAKRVSRPAPHSIVKVVGASLAWTTLEVHDHFIYGSALV
jgi:hypothetical protein